MTEEEWLTTSSTMRFTEFIDQEKIRGRGAQRRRVLRLMRCALFRIAWYQLPDDLLRQAVTIAEEFADDLCTREKAMLVRREVALTAHWLKSPFVEGCYQLLDPTAHRQSSRYLPSGLLYTGTLLADLIRDIFGNPFKPVAFNPNWRTSDVTAMARGMYETRDFSAMPILADALQDAGCESDEVLNHCRGPGPHVRGCWVVDQVLEKV